MEERGFFKLNFYNENYELVINNKNTKIGLSRLIKCDKEEIKNIVLGATDYIITDKLANEIYEETQKLKGVFEKELLANAQTYNIAENTKFINEVNNAKFHTKKNKLATGIHNDILYYGFSIQNPQSRMKDFIITSNRTKYVNDEIISFFGNDYLPRIFNFRFDWTTTGILDFLNGKKVSLADVFERVLNIQKKCVWHNKIGYHETIVCDIISTYYISLWFSKARTFFYGEKGVGKTQQINVYATLSFRAINTSDTTQASIFRLSHYECPTILIDDFDDYDKEKTNAIKHILKAYKKNQTATRVNDNNRNKVDSFDIFANVIFNNTAGVDNILLDRCVQHVLIHCPKNFTPLNIERIADTSDIVELRNDLFNACLSDFLVVKKNYEELEKNLTTNNRETEKLLPILAIAKSINEEVYEKVSMYLEDANKNAVEVDSDNETTKETILLYYLYNLTKNNDTIKKTAKEIAQDIAYEIIPYENPESPFYQKDMHSLVIWVGKKLRRFGFLCYVSNGKSTIIIKKTDVSHILNTTKQKFYLQNITSYYENKQENNEQQQ